MWQMKLNYLHFGIRVRIFFLISGFERCILQIVEREREIERERRCNRSYIVINYVYDVIHLTHAVTQNV